MDQILLLCIVNSWIDMVDNHGFSEVCKVVIGSRIIIASGRHSQFYVFNCIESRINYNDLCRDSDNPNSRIIYQTTTLPSCFVFMRKQLAILSASCNFQERTSRDVLKPRRSTRISAFAKIDHLRQLFWLCLFFSKFGIWCDKNFMPAGLHFLWQRVDLRKVVKHFYYIFRYCPY